jgi:hypothetical protein
MNYAELLGLMPSFGLDRSVEADTAVAEIADRKPTVPAAETGTPVTFTQEQLKLLAALGQTGQGQQRPPGAVPPRVPAMMPMTQLTLPQTAQAPRPGLAQLIYGR